MEDAVYVVAVRRGKSGNLSEFKLNDGRVLNFSDAYHAAESGEIPSLATGVARNGELTIRSARGYDNYKLDDLPTF